MNFKKSISLFITATMAISAVPTAFASTDLVTSDVTFYNSSSQSTTPNNAAYVSGTAKINSTSSDYSNAKYIIASYSDNTCAKLTGVTAASFVKGTDGYTATTDKLNTASSKFVMEYYLKGTTLEPIVEAGFKNINSSDDEWTVNVTWDGAGQGEYPTTATAKLYNKNISEVSKEFPIDVTSYDVHFNVNQQKSSYTFNTVGGTSGLIMTDDCFAADEDYWSVDTVVNQSTKVATVTIDLTSPYPSETVSPTYTPAPSYTPAPVYDNNFTLEGENGTFSGTNMSSSKKLSGNFDGIYDITKWSGSAGALVVRDTFLTWNNVIFPVTDDYTISIKGCSYTGNPDKTVTIVIDDSYVLSGTLTTAASSDDIVLCNIGTTPITAGNHRVQIYSETDDWNPAMVDYVQFKSTKEIINPTPVPSPTGTPAPFTVSGNVYVSPNGNDGNNGLTTGTPVRTLQRALNVATSLSASTTNDIKISVGNGEYELSTPLTVTPSDNHKNNGKISFVGNGDVTVSGGRKVSGWTQYSTNIYSADVNVDDIRQLWANDVKQVRAKSDSMSISAIDTTNGTYSCRKDLSNLTSARYAEFVTDVNWARQRLPISSVSATSTKSVITIKQPYFNYLATKQLQSYGVPSTYTKFYIENDLSLLDAEGEYYFDKDAKKLYYYPNSADELNNVYVGVTSGLLMMNGDNQNNKVKNFTFDGLNFKYGTWLKPNTTGVIVNQAENLVNRENSETLDEGERLYAQIQLNWTDNVTITNGALKCLGSSAFDINAGNSNCTVSNIIFEQLSGGAAMIGGWNHKRTSSDPIITDNVKFTNNVIQNSSLEYANCPYVSVYYCTNCELSHNSLYDAPYTGISVGWGWNADVIVNGNHNISYNKIMRSVTTLRDGGPLYLLGYMATTNINHNYIDKSSDLLGGYRGGVYFDQGTTGVNMTENVIANCYNWVFARDDVKIGASTITNNYADRSNCVITSTITSSNNTACTSGWNEAATNIINQSGSTLG